ncbi:hypothetical protein QBC45DRAFT_128810 [Copromyces sp. CBS 386.78]|nr:hypothetical protein QBC45DRAFT_128810 [Copromyces sp. CBS 386.78]
MRPWEAGPGSMEARTAAASSASEHGERHVGSLIPYARPRVANACDVCKRRKVKCNGGKPCSYCLSRKLPSLCVYSPPRQRRPRASRLSGIQGGVQEEPSQTSRGARSSSRGIEDGAPHSAASPQPSISPSRGHAGAAHSAPVGSPHARTSSRSSRKESPPLVTKESQTPSRRSLPGAARGARGVGEGSRSGQSRPQSQQGPQRNQHDAAHQRGQEQEQEQEEEEEQEPQPQQPDAGSGPGPGPGAEAHNEETEVPREGRLLVDPQGKLIFIGDCAPLSFFRTVQRLITSRIDPDAFAPENSGYSALENNNASYHPRTSGGAVFPGGGGNGGGYGGLGYSGGDGRSGRFGPGPPLVQMSTIEPAVTAYFQSTTGLIDIFDDDQAQQPRQLIEDITSWAAQLRGGGGGGGGGVPPGGDATSALFYLVLAIGLLFQKNSTNSTNTKSSSSPSEVGSSFSESESIAQAYFDHARDLAFANLTGNLGLASVQSFILITLYMLGACQINGAFIFFGIAARSAFSIGIHRTEVNARFSPEIHRQRDRLWKSLRVVDLFLSTSMGRPPATSDVDCTVLYHDVDGEGREQTDPEAGGDCLLNGSAQIFLIIEGIVLEVYSRRKISPQLTEGISRELREWSARWLQRLKRVIEERRPSPRQTPLPSDQQGGLTAAGAMANGACQVLASYYYAVILVSRPFLMVELRRRLAEGYPTEAFTAKDGLVTSGKSKLADACIDAASLMVDPIQDLIQRGLMTRRAPVIVSWLFASSLVLGLGLLGGFGRIIEKYCRASIAALEYFAEADAHAVQYSLIAKSLLNTALAYLEKREMQDRLRRTESSSQLFGLIPRGDSGDDTTHDNNNNHNTTTNDHEDPNPSNSHQHQHDQQSHYQRSIQHTNPSVGGHFAGGIHGSIRGGGSTHPQQQQQQPKPLSYPIGTTHHHNYHHHHHHHTPPTSSFFSPSRFNNTNNNMNHNHFDFVGHGHESTATTFLGMTESLPRTPEFSIMGGSLDSDADQTFGAMNLFPLLETDGHIDLAYYF